MTASPPTGIDLLKTLVDREAPDEWFVTDGATAVGPVGLDLLARGIAAGKVPADAFVRHVSWSGWRGLGDFVEHEPSFDPRRTFRVLPAVQVAPVPSQPRLAPSRPRLPSEEVELEPEPEEIPPPRPSQPFDGVADLREALLLLLATAAQDCAAQAALIHGARDEGAVVVCSFGPRMFELLGVETPATDPVLAAAKAGHTVLAEPLSGTAGRTTKTRLSRLGSKIEAAFMVPVGVEGRLLAFLEVGRDKPFRAHDVAHVEGLVDTLVATVTELHWAREWQPPKKKLS